MTPTDYSNVMANEGQIPNDLSGATLVPVLMGAPRVNGLGQTGIMSYLQSGTSISMVGALAILGGHMLKKRTGGSVPLILQAGGLTLIGYGIARMV